MPVSSVIRPSLQAVVGQPMLRQGSSGPEVERLQRLLSSAGFSVAVDGAFGPATRRVVESFQRRLQLGVDGVVGPRTWAALLASSPAWPATPSTGPLSLNDGNSMRPGSTAAQAPIPEFADLRRQGYRLYPIAQLNVLNSVAAQGRDASLASQRVGAGGYDVVANGTFYFPGTAPSSSAAVVRDGGLDTQGIEKTSRRAGVAILSDGTIAVARMDGASLQTIKNRYGGSLTDFMGGGALLIEDGRAVSSRDLLERQKFDQGDGGINAQQMRRTDHTLIGIRDGQAFLIGASDKTGAQMQAQLLAAGFDSVVKFDGGSGSYLRDRSGSHFGGTNTFGFGVKVRG
jgi:hypothetical protein